MRPLIKRITGDTRSGKEKIMSHLTFFVKRWSKQELDLSFLELDELTPKLFDLQSIKHLNLSNNHLKCIPEDIKNLDRLETLDISFNEISSFPELQKLPSSLKRLILRGNNITEVRIDHAPEESNLISLDLESNKIRSFLYFSASRSGLRELNLRRNHLKVFRISAPSSLESLDLSQNSMKSIDCETLSLDLLRQVFLCENELKSIPSFVFSSPLLEKLDISSNKLSYISDEMAPRLTKLQSLYLSGNNLSYLPENLFLLENLQEIKISENNIKILNPSISRLSNLNFIELLGNPIESPPKAVIEQGSSATIRFLREIDSQSASGIYHRLWISKLMVVGEGGVGKTSLIKALKGESCDPAETTTHGIQLDKIEILHPYESEILMNLNIWDFGGQQIYHATHQFFLTDNSVFIFAWNSRTEFNQGRPYYWLDMITANAPNAPIILVATHLDQRRELIPLDYLREKYPQIIDFFEVSNIDQKNIDLLYAKIRELAAGLPLMGKPWPERWDEASAALKKIPEKLISRNQLFEVFKEHSLDVEESEILAKYLHDLGEILQYPESEALKELVVLKPQWISEHISKVITNDSVLDSKGILHQDVISEEWADLDKSMQELFLELMEQYDLAYKIPGDKANRALIVEQLHPDRPEEYRSWQQKLADENLRRIDIEYRLSSMQPGLPTWFIARSHRFSLGIHWRSGAIFSDGNQNRNQALIEALPQEKLIRLSVLGSSPHNFMSILKDGLELTFARYPGLKVHSLVPCISDSGESACEGRFPYKKLEEALDRGLPSIQCSSCFEQVEISQLLFGIGGSANSVFTNLEERVIGMGDLIPGNTIFKDQSSQFQSQVFLIHQMHRIVHDALSEFADTQNSEIKELRATLESISDNFDLLHRRFISQFRILQSSHESHCPSTFLFHVGKQPENIFDNSPLELHLLCQFPKQLHPATLPIENHTQYDPYIVQRPKEWLLKVVPYIRAVFQLVSYAPIVPNSPLAEVADLTEKCLEHMEYFLGKVDSFPEAQSILHTSQSSDLIMLDGAQLRVFRTLLDELDSTHEWQGLRKWLSPEGHFLWLCPYHYHQCGKHFSEL